MLFRSRPDPGTRRTRATASLRRPVPAPGAFSAGRFVAAAGDEDEYEVGVTSSSSKLLSDTEYLLLLLNYL